MRNVILITSALFVLCAACEGRILPPPLDGGDGGAGGEAATAKPAPTATPEECVGLKCSGQWRR